ncbi:MAG: DUF1893 domain-containing protein [Defluviitaleaceae bacterium]|nr:DUF1893 domain-containing protein [Defluviitaleaceae bacterium]
MEPLQKAIEELQSSNASCVGFGADGVLAFKSCENGVKPLMERIAGDADGLRGLYVADKVIGKAAASVMIYNGVAACHGLVVSEAAARILRENGVEFSYGQIVPYIKNRAGTGMCPMEKCVEAAETAEEGFRAISVFLGR